MKTTKKQRTASKYIEDTSREYSIYVCENRAIPNVTDGLKDSQRKALWTIRNKSEKIKTISLAGEMISSGLYLAGDTAGAMAASMLAAPYVNNVTLLEGIGAFGTRVAPVDGIGAPRYTYLKKSSYTDKLVLHDLDIVPLKDNYDGSTKQPVHFLPLIPLVLLNGVTGIAVGWSTNILPRNLKKLISATQQVLEGKKPRGLEPSFDYMDVSVVTTEDGSWEFYGKVEIVDTSTIKITELPPSLSLVNMRARLNKMEEENKIVSYTDRSTGKINITIKFKRGELKDWTVEDAIAFFKLKEKSTERLVVVDWDGSRIRQFSDTTSLIQEFVEWRLSWFKTRYSKMLNDTDHELRYWKGIKECFDDKMPERIIKKADKSAVVADISSVTASIGLTDQQIDKIANLPSYKWAKDFYSEVKDHIKRLTSDSKEYSAILKSPTRMKEIYMAELEELKKLK